MNTSINFLLFSIFVVSFVHLQTIATFHYLNLLMNYQHECKYLGNVFLNNYQYVINNVIKIKMLVDYTLLKLISNLI